MVSRGRTQFAPTVKGGSICKNSAVLFTFCEFYGIITLGSYLLDKLKFDFSNTSKQRRIFISSAKEKRFSKGKKI